MLKRIKGFFVKLYYSLPFAMKGGEVLISSSKDKDNFTIQQTLQKSTLAKDLLNAEVTQEVEELRYQTYVVTEKSKNFKYIGEGVAVKVDDDKHTNRVTFQQLNKRFVRGVLEEMERVDKKEYGKEEYTLEIIHDITPRFKIEKYCMAFTVSINPSKDDKERDTITLAFDTFSNDSDITSRMFNNEIEAVYKKQKRTSELKEFKHLTFITFNVYGENDLIRYVMHDLKLIDILKTDSQYILTYDIGSYVREDLTTQFYSKSMDDKYASKARKMTSYSFETQTESRCEECGEVINSYDYTITKETIGKGLCQKCLAKALKDKE